MRSYKTEGIVIKRRNFGESDRILTLLTNSYGKIQAKAPGVRKITSRRSSHTELLNLTFLTLYKSPRSSLPIVIEAKASEEFLSIKNSLKKIGYAYYICELIDILCAQSQENRRVFFLARDTLFQLSNNIGNTSAIEYFEDELLVTLGFLPRTHKLIDKRNFIESIVE
ncbi:MAG: DNA repair protein RecO, partial [Candidatus Levybacteria bacterium RIFCSPHIGHO2_01_FULL_38_26]